MKLNNKGLTLVELLISIVLTGIVLAFLFNLLVDLKDETDNSDFAYNNQVNRLEVIYAVQKELIQYPLAGIQDLSVNNNIRINFYYRKGGMIKTSVLSTDKTPGSILSDDKYYIRYTNINEETTTWLMKGASIDKCGMFTFLIDSTTNNYYFHLNIPLYNSVYNEKNNSNNNNTVDDIEISYTGSASTLTSDSGYLTSNSGDKQIGNCTN